MTWIIPNWVRGLLALVLLALSLILLALGLARTGSPLTVEVDGQRHEVRTHATTVGEALRRAGFDLYPEDRVSPGMEVPLQPGMVVDVQCARPAKLHVDGHTLQLRTHATTVGQLLAEAKVQLGPADEIWFGDRLVGPDEPLWESDLPVSREVSHRGGSRTPLATEEMQALPVLLLRRAISVTLEDGGNTRILRTTSDTVGQVLREHGISLYLGDRLMPGFQDRVTPGMTVSIWRSVPVQIEVDGHTIRTRTRASDVAGALGQEGIALVGRDRVEPALSAPIRSGTTIRVSRVREELVVEFDPIPFETEWIPDPEVEIDNIRLVREGQVGLTKRRFRVMYENDQEIERYLEDV
ncbi:MAG TPA: ubiquitin-like domain-containing protein, partial [Anaerolineae bacterium]|nr:ubiquitin-like domain-containing protein [Anaerolineae bacterium]